jgi:hypothetical protein
MAPKAEQLGLILENIQLFLQRKFDEREDFKEISQNLDKLQINLKQKKLLLKIVSTNLSLAQGLSDLIKTNELLKEFYQLTFHSLPQLPTQQQQFAGIKLKQVSDRGTNSIQSYQLNGAGELSFGRSPECDVSLDPSLYRGVSWNHGTIKAMVSDSKDFQWQICDLESTNGTFVNGEKIQQCQLLKPGDRITLAAPLATIQNGVNIAEFVLTIDPESIEIEADREYWELIDCDLLLIAIDGKQPLSIKEKNFIQNFDNAFISKQYIVADIPDPKPENNTAQVVETNLANLESWLKNEVKKKDFDLFSVHLRPYYDHDVSVELNVKLQKKQDQFLKVLESIVKRQPENVLAKRLSLKAIRELKPVKLFLQESKKSLIQNIELEEQRLASSSQINWKDIAKKTITQVERDKDLLFKQIKLDLSQSKVATLDNFAKHSLIYKIENFVDGLNPVIVTKNGQKIILLNDESYAGSNDINTILIEFCTTSLKKWSIKEWQKITNTYGNGGLNGFLTRATQQVNVQFILSSKSFFISPDTIDIENNFLLSFVGLPCETVYKQKSLTGYIVKELRGNIMAIMMPITLLIPLVFVGDKVSKGQIFGTIAKLFNQHPWILGIVVCVAIYLFINSYNRDAEEKIEEVSQKLKKELSGYYQSFTKNLLDKIIQDINLALESEDKKIIDSLESINKAYSERIIDLEKHQIEIKTNLEQSKIQQKNLDVELFEFDKLMK